MSRPGTTMRGVEHPLPSIEDVIDATIRAGRLTNPAIQCIGIAINTEALEETRRPRPSRRHEPGASIASGRSDPDRRRRRSSMPLAARYPA